MSAMDIDKPLDEIIAAKPKARRGKKGGATRGSGAARDTAAAPAPAAGRAGGARARYANAVPGSAGARNAAPAASKGVSVDAVKIIISNLPADVTEAAVRDLMQSTIGPVRSVQMSYTASGKSTGQGTVIFKSKGDANKAHAAYHNRMIDNQRPMKVEIALDPSQMQSLASRVAPAPAAGGAPRNPPAAKRAPKPRPARPAKKTAEELDAEMAAYKDNNAA